MLKSLEENATYEPSKRSANRFKLKKDYLDSGSLGDSIDLVVVGADYGKGKRTGLFGSFLMACYNPNTDMYQTVTKVATGLSEEMLKKLTDQLNPLIRQEASPLLVHKKKNVDVWFEPSFVWEVRCADLSLSPTYCAASDLLLNDKGIALRFPRFIRERSDKDLKQATTSNQLFDHYKEQGGIII